MVDYDDSDSQSDLDQQQQLQRGGHFAGTSSSSGSSSDGHRPGGDSLVSEWVECSETVSGRTIWYNRDTLMVTFEDPLSRTAGSRVRGAFILKQSIAREDLEVEAIPEALLRFGRGGVPGIHGNLLDFVRCTAALYRIRRHIRKLAGSL